MDSAAPGVEMGGLEAQAEVSESMAELRPLLGKITTELATLGKDLPHLTQRIQKAKQRGAVRALREVRRASKTLRERSRRIEQSTTPAAELMARLTRACVTTLTWTRSQQDGSVDDWARLLGGTVDTVGQTRVQFRSMEIAIVELRGRNIARDLNEACDDLLGSLMPFLESMDVFVDELSQALEGG